MKPSNEVLDEAISKLEEAETRIRNSFALARSAANRAGPVLAALAKHEPSLKLQTWQWIGMAWGEAAVWITLPEQDSWGCATPLIEKLEFLGFPLDSWASSDDAKNFARTFSASMLTDFGDEVYHQNEELRILITVLLREGNTGGCRRVFVGTKKETSVTEEEEYKLVCDEETPA